MKFRIKLAVMLTVFIATVFAMSADSTGNGAPSFKIFGEVDNPVELTIADLRAMPIVKIETKDHDGKTAVFEGVSLWDVINKAKPRLGEKRSNGIAKSFVVVRAVDHYQAVFALAEIEPSFTDKKIILAYQRDGAPLDANQGPFQIIAPEDKIHARWVRQALSLEIVSSKPAR